jgi:glycolate oxidase FAD binding subunit
MLAVTPSSAEELAHLLEQANAQSKTIAVAGNGSKHSMGGPVLPADYFLSTKQLNRVLQYEPNDLTVSVEAGMSFFALRQLLARHRQMIALDPPFSQDATVGGVIASNGNGPIRRLYGTARDLVIGMEFATVDGKIANSGGMVVKNVAGLDMGKLLIGSFGTLAVLTSVNFRLHAMPEQTSTFLYSSTEMGSALEKRDWLLRGVLLPLAVDLLSPPVAARAGQRGYVLAIRAAGSQKVLERYAKELHDAEKLGGSDEEAFWKTVGEFTADFLRRQPGGVVVRVSTALSEIGSLFRLMPGAILSRAGSGVSYVYLTSWNGVEQLKQAAAKQGWTAVVEYAPDEIRTSRQLWLSGGAWADAGTFDMMKKIKLMFDPKNLLNRSRLYGRL